MATRGSIRRLSALLATGALLLVVGCSSAMISQKSWAGALERMDGVTSVKLQYRNNWPTSGKQYLADIVVSPQLTETQARAIAEESCRHNTRITEVNFNTTADRLTKPQVIGRELAGSSCIQQEALMNFARTAAAVHPMPSFNGEIRVYGIVESNYEDDKERVGAFSVSIEADGIGMALKAISSLRAHLPDLALEIRTQLEKVDPESSQTSVWLTAMFTPNAELSRLNPIIDRAFLLDAVSLKVTDSSVTILPRTSAVLDSPELGSLTTNGEKLGIQVAASFLPFRSGGTDADNQAQSELVHAILAVPGGALIENPGSNLSITANNLDSVEAIAHLLATAPKDFAGARIYGPASQYFWVAINTGHVTSEQVSGAVPVALPLPQQVPAVERVIVTLTEDSNELSVHLDRESSAEDESVARQILAPIARSGVFTEVRLSTPNSDTLGEPVT